MNKDQQNDRGVEKPKEARHQEQNYTSRSAPGKTNDKPAPEPEPYHKSLHDAEGYKGNPGKAGGAAAGQDASAQDVKQDRSADGQMLRQMQQGDLLDSPAADAPDGDS